jgi:polar amino acid transport system substrate-binding protein
MRRAIRRAPALAAACAALALAVSACGTGPDRAAQARAPLHSELPAKIRETGLLKVGGSTTVAPYLYRDGSDVEGLEKDLMDALAGQLGVRIQFFDSGFAALVPGLQSGKLDVVMGDFTDTKERQQAVSFVDYTTSYQTLFVQNGNPRRLRKAADLCGDTVAAGVGSLSAQLAEAQDAQCRHAGRSGVKVLELDNAAAGMMQVRTGRAQAVLIDYLIGRHVAENSRNGQVAGTPFHKQFHGAAVRKGNARLEKAMLDAFRSIMADGQYEKILRKWGIEKLALPAPIVNGGTS